MDSQNLSDMSILLNNIAKSGLVSATYNKINAIKKTKTIEEQKNNYDEIVNDLLTQNQELLSIAMNFKEEYERVNISDDDILHLRNTLERVVKLFYEEDSEDEHNMRQFIDLVQVDTLKTMQLLGFNYKKAIGELLTEVCANKINNLLN